MPAMSSEDAALTALRGSLAGSVRLFEEAAADDPAYGPFLVEVRAELNRVDALQTQIKN